MEDKSNATAELQKIPKKALRQCFQQRHNRWSKCVRAQGSYYKADWVSVVICRSITVLYHISGNFLTAPCIHFLNTVFMCTARRNRLDSSPAPYGHD
jgi:hypothetical protein